MWSRTIELHSDSYCSEIMVAWCPVTKQQIVYFDNDEQRMKVLYKLYIFVICNLISSYTKEEDYIRIIWSYYRAFYLPIADIQEFKEFCRAQSLSYLVCRQSYFTFYLFFIQISKPMLASIFKRMQFTILISLPIYWSLLISSHFMDVCRLWIFLVM